MNGLDRGRGAKSRIFSHFFATGHAENMRKNRARIECFQSVMWQREKKTHGRPRSSPRSPRVRRVSKYTAGVALKGCYRHGTAVGGMSCLLEIGMIALGFGEGKKMSAFASFAV